MPQYVVGYTKKDDGSIDFMPVISGQIGEGQNFLAGFEFSTPAEANTIALALEEQGATPESAYNLVPIIAQEEGVPILNPQEPPPVSGTAPLSDADAIEQGEQGVVEQRDQAREARNRDISSVANATMTPSSALADQHSYNRYSMDNRDPTPFGDTLTGQAEKDFLAQNAFGGGGTGAPVGSSETDWGVFEEDLIAGRVDPRRAVSEQLSQQGLPTHANRGFLEDLYSNYGTLRQMQNPGMTPEPVDLFNEQSQFANDLMGMDGGSMRRVDTRGLWDNQFSEDYVNALGNEYDTVAANGEGAGEQHEYEFRAINSNIAALSPFIGEQNAGYLMTLTQQAYDEYINSPARNQMTFAVCLRDVKGAGEWY